ncbi:PH domain-containing protein [Deinococcus sp.]|uniref:PH domain-containing protein n=1 Tax=Deinococcus sp. TaxID=47478 RepID=UPI003C7A7E5C
MTLAPAPLSGGSPGADVATATGSRAAFRVLRLGFAALLLALAVLLVLPPLLGYPRFEVSGGVLTVRSITTHRILSAQTPVQTVTLPPLSKTIGTAGGQRCTGRFRDAPGRIYELYTDCSSRVLLFSPSGRRPIAITPDDPQALLGALRSGENATFRLPAPGIPLNSWLTALPLLIVAVLSLWPWPSLRYRLTPGALEIRRRLGVDRLPYSGLKVRRARNPLGTRLIGTGMPGYHTGLYSLAGDPVMAVATSSRAPGLLLTSGETTYYLTPADVGALMTELERRGATLQGE